MLGGVIYLYDITNDRFSDRGETILTLFRQPSRCSEATLDKVILVTTKWSRQGHYDFDFGKKEEELRDVHWKRLLRSSNGKRGASMKRLDHVKSGGEGASAWAIVTEILKQLDGRLSQKAPDEVMQPEEAHRLGEMLKDLERNKNPLPTRRAWGFRHIRRWFSKS